MCNLGIFSSSKLKRAKVLQVREDTPKSYLFSSRKTKVTDGGKNKTSAYTVPVKLGMAWPLMNGFAHNQASDKKTEPLCEVSVAGHISRKPKSRQSNIKTDKPFFFFWQREFIIGVFSTQLNNNCLLDLFQTWKCLIVHRVLSHLASTTSQDNSTGCILSVWT